MLNISFPVAFVAGLASFFAPCVVPLVPAYIGYVTGVSLSHLKAANFAKYRRQVLIESLFYILGFSLVFVVLGVSVASIGRFLRQYNFYVQRLGGLLIVILGLNFAGLLRLPFLAQERKFTLPSWINKFKHLRPFSLGLVFAFAWTPCVGAVLGTILTLAAVSATAAQGALLLFTYSLGISLPFITFSLLLAQSPLYIKAITKYVAPLSFIAGLLLAAIGFLLFTDTYKYVNSWLFDIAFKLGYKIR